MKALLRLKSFQSQIAPFSKSFSSTSTAMAGLDINSRYRMLSGYEIPVLGYGVCMASHSVVWNRPCETLHSQSNDLNNEDVVELLKAR